MKHIKLYENHMYEAESEMNAIASSYDVAKVLASELTAQELEELVNFYNTEGKEAVAELISTVEDTTIDESMMSQKEIRVRSILDKIIKYGSVAAMAGIVPAMMAGAPFLALGLGIAALAGCSVKDAAWWKKEGHYHADQDKYGVK
jgi:hypothetical protein